MARNVLPHVPKHAQNIVATYCRTIFAQSDAAAVHAQFDRVIVRLESAKSAKVAHVPAEVKNDLLAFYAFSKTVS